MKPLQGIRILSLALNLPGPAAMMRLEALGANCRKLEPPGGDPMQMYAGAAYSQMHQGIRVTLADLKTDAGQAKLAKELAQADVLLTSFRASALKRLGLSWPKLRKAYPKLSMVSIVGDVHAPEVAGHDLTYMAECGLIPSQALPSSLFADMGGSLVAVQAVLCAVLKQRETGRGCFQEVGLAQAAQYLALPHQWGLTRPEGLIGGAHALYQVFACADGRVALAALEPHFSQRVCKLVGWPDFKAADALSPALKRKVAAFMKRRSCAELQALGEDLDLPLHVMPDPH